MCVINGFINWVGRFLPHFILRLMVAWQAWDFGLVMYRGTDGFLPIQNMMPFILMSNSISWAVIMWWSLAGAIFLVLGFRTRLVVAGLLLIAALQAMVAIPTDYNIFAEIWRSASSDVWGFKLGLLYLGVMSALLLMGSGGLSLDALTGWFACGRCARKAKAERKARKDTRKQPAKKRPSRITRLKSGAELDREPDIKKPAEHTKITKSYDKVTTDEPASSKPEATASVASDSSAVKATLNEDDDEFNELMANNGESVFEIDPDAEKSIKDAKEKLKKIKAKFEEKTKAINAKKCIKIKQDIEDNDDEILGSDNPEIN
jgi:putative oxidoreductase